MAVGDVLRTQRGRRVMFVSLAAVLLATSRRAKARAPSKFLKPQQPFDPQRYTPGSPPQVALFVQASDAAGVPSSWASEPGLIEILKNESSGWVGIPNYTYGERSKNKELWPQVWAELRQGAKTATSSATGLGQLLLSNVAAFYPDGPDGIGDALNEAVGMLRYIRSRYGTPAEAWRCYGKLCTDIPGKPDKTFQEGY